MPREIADSDDELDFVPTAKLTKSTVISYAVTTEDTCNADQLDPVLGTDFDQFLSPTQRLSSYDAQHENTNDISTSRFLDSSTNRFLDAVGPSSGSSSQEITHATNGSQSAGSDMGGKQAKDKAPLKKQNDKKRSRSQVEDAESTLQEGQVAKKRAKATYGSMVTSSNKSKNASEFEALTHRSTRFVSIGHQNDGSLDDPNERLPEMVSIDARTDYTSPLDLSLHLSPTSGEQMVGGETSVVGDVPTAGAYAPPELYRPRDNTYGSALRGVTTSNSSMGNYQSFSINPDKLGMDFDKINPFGSLSQVSLSGDLDSEETRGIADIFRNSASFSNRVTLASQSIPSHKMALGVEHDMQTTPIEAENEFNLRSRAKRSEHNDAQCSPPFSQITSLDEQNVDGIVSATRQCSEQEPAKTIDGVAAKPAPKKRGRKPKESKKVATPDFHENDVDELQADEQPLDRRKRAGTIDSVSNISEVSQVSDSSRKGQKRRAKKDMAPPDLQSKKLPSSDLGLDNKNVIGLSPERYVPRPSRRRGQVDSQVEGSSIAAVDTGDEQADPMDEVTAKPSPAKAKKGKRGRKKGNKATETAIARQDGDIEAADTKAEVVMLEDDFSANNKTQAMPHGDQDELAEDQIMANQESDDGDEDVIKGGHRNTKISVDIPIFAKPDENENLPPPVAEPKKRGRKRKKPVEEPVGERKHAETARTPLSEKDANIQVDKADLGNPAPDDTSTAEDQGPKRDINTEEEEEPKDSKSSVPIQSNTPLKSTTTNISTSTPSLKSLLTPRARIGLSKRHSIPSLLRKVDRNKEAPKTIERKEKVTKRMLEEREQERIAREEAEAEGREYTPLDVLRDKDGRLVEWDF